MFMFCICSTSLSFTHPSACQTQRSAQRSSRPVPIVFHQPPRRHHQVPHRLVPAVEPRCTQLRLLDLHAYVPLVVEHVQLHVCHAHRREQPPLTRQHDAVTLHRQPRRPVVEVHHLHRCVRHVHRRHHSQSSRDSSRSKWRGRLPTCS